MPVPVHGTGVIAATDGAYEMMPSRQRQPTAGDNNSSSMNYTPGAGGAPIDGPYNAVTTVDPDNSLSPAQTMSNTNGNNIPQNRLFIFLPQQTHVDNPGNATSGSVTAQDQSRAPADYSCSHHIQDSNKFNATFQDRSGNDCSKQDPPKPFAKSS